MKNETTIDSYAMVQSKTVNMEKMLESFQVTNDEELAIVSDKIKQVKALKNFIEEEKDKFVKPAKAIIAEAKEKYDGHIKKCENAEIVLKMRAGNYMQAQEKARREEEAKIAAKVESGYIKPETAMAKVEALAEVKTSVKTLNGSGLRMAKRKVAKITDPNLVPDEYWVIDEVRVRREAMEKEKNNLPQIPGVTIVEETSMASV